MIDFFEITQVIFDGDVMKHMSGGCLCGEVKYKVNAEPLAMGFCHCRSCQRATGAGYIAWILLPADSLKIDGNFKEYQSIGGSGESVYRGFCANCGSRLFFRGDKLEGLKLVSASSLDDPSQFKPQMHIWTQDAQHWDCMDDETVKFSQNPTEQG